MAYIKGVGFTPLSITHLTQFLGLASTERTASLLKHPEEKIPEVASGLPEWERYLRWLFFGEGGPRREGDCLVLPVRDSQGMSPQVALVPLGTPYGAYHFGYVVSPILKDAASGLYMLMPGVAEGDGSPLLAFLYTPHKKPTPLALVLLELRRESVLVKEGE
jgi:hypothetical protein